MRKRRRLLPKPPEPPEGYMWLYWELVPIEEAELRAKLVMRGFDKLPRKKRDSNQGGGWARANRLRARCRRPVCE